MDETAAAKLASRLALAYPGRSIDIGHIASWTEELAELDHELATQAVRQLRREAVNPPSVAALLDVVAEVRGEMARTARAALPPAAPRPVDEEAEALARKTFHEARMRLRKRPRTPMPVMLREERIFESDEVIERRRRQQLEEFRARYGEELESARHLRMRGSVHEGMGL